MKLYTFAKLLETMEVKEAKALLAEAQIPVVNGYFDKDRLDAVMAMPKELRTKRFEWGLSPTHGIGAVKACVDAAGLNLTAHYLSRSNGLDITSAKGKTRGVRMYYTNRTSDEDTVARFNVINFINDDPNAYYALCALTIPAMWVFSNKELRAKWNKLRFDTDKIKAVHLNSPTGIWIPISQYKNQKGGLRFKLSSHESQYRVSSAALGL